MKLNLQETKNKAKIEEGTIRNAEARIKTNKELEKTTTSDELSAVQKKIKDDEENIAKSQKKLEEINIKIRGFEQKLLELEKINRENRLIQLAEIKEATLKKRAAIVQATRKRQAESQAAKAKVERNSDAITGSAFESERNIDIILDLIDKYDEEYINKLDKCIEGEAYIPNILYDGEIKPVNEKIIKKKIYPDFRPCIGTDIIAKHESVGVEFKSINNTQIPGGSELARIYINPICAMLNRAKDKISEIYYGITDKERIIKGISFKGNLVEFATEFDKNIRELISKNLNTYGIDIMNNIRIHYYDISLSAKLKKLDASKRAKSFDNKYVVQMIITGCLDKDVQPITDKKRIAWQRTISRYQKEGELMPTPTPSTIGVNSSILKKAYEYKYNSVNSLLGNDVTEDDDVEDVEDIEDFELLLSEQIDQARQDVTDAQQFVLFANDDENEYAAAVKNLQQAEIKLKKLIEEACAEKARAATIIKLS